MESRWQLAGEGRTLGFETSLQLQIIEAFDALMAELADALGLGPSAARRGGSTPSKGTISFYKNTGD